MNRNNALILIEVAAPLCAEDPVPHEPDWCKEETGREDSAGVGEEGVEVNRLFPEERFTDVVCHYEWVDNNIEADLADRQTPLSLGNSLLVEARSQHVEQAHDCGKILKGELPVNHLNQHILRD